jgi:hypothetical protein
MTIKPVKEDPFTGLFSWLAKRLSSQIRCVVVLAKGDYSNLSFTQLYGGIMETKDELELPQIRFPIRGKETKAELAAEQIDIEKFIKVVERAFGAIAKATGLSDRGVLHAIEETNVEMQKDVLKDGINVDALRDGIQEAIKVISLATALDTAQISDIFTAKKDTNIKDLVNRLYRSGQANRAKFGIGVGNMLSI